jgi:hypothetical protein
MWKKALLLSLASSVIGIALPAAEGITVNLKLDSIQRVGGGLADNVAVSITLANNTKAADVATVNLAVTAVCPFRAAPISVQVPLTVTLKPGETSTRKLIIPIPHPKLLKPLDVTIAAIAKGAVSKTQSASSVSFKLLP